MSNPDTIARESLRNRLGIIDESRLRLADPRTPAQIRKARIQTAWNAITKARSALAADGFYAADFAVLDCWSQDEFDAAVKGRFRGKPIEIVVDLHDLGEGEELPLRMRGSCSPEPGVILDWQATGEVYEVQGRLTGVWNVATKAE